MFTGIIEETGTVRSVARGSESARISILAHLVCQGTRIGDSISVNGACLTVTECSPSGFTADVMAETLARTTLGALRPGSAANLERALTLSSRLGGHLVSGHIDGTGTIASIRRNDIASIMTITCEPRLLRYIAEKGSVALDGASLTVCAVTDSGFSVSLIPHTREATALGSKKNGDALNIECDLLARYLERLSVTAPQDQNDSDRNSGYRTKLTASFLQEQGFSGGIG